MKRKQVRIRFTLMHEGKRYYGSILCLLENAEMIECHFRQDGCDRVWISD
jgi:hypothetical protein